MSILKKEESYEKYEISITGMTCSNCSNYLESSLRIIPLIKTANINLILENALIVVENFNYNKIISIPNKGNKEKLKDNASFLQMIIESFGFGVLNVNKIDDKVSKGKRNLILVFEKSGSYSDFNKQEQHSLFEIKDSASGLNKENELQILNSHKFNSFSNNENSISDNNSKFKNEKEKIIKTDILEKEEIEFLLQISGVLNSDLIKNAYYNLSYDSAIIKGSELFEKITFAFSEIKSTSAQKDSSKEEEDLNLNFKSKNKYKIIYTNEFKKNITEIYQFNPTTNFTKMLLCILLLAAIFLFTFICQTFENYFTQIKISSNIHLFLLLGFCLNALMIFFYGFKIYKKSFNAFLNSYLVNMDTLISLGSISAIFLTLLNFFYLLNIGNNNTINNNNNNTLNNNNNNINNNQAEILIGNIMTLHCAEAAAAVIAISVIGKYVEEKAKNNIKKLTVNMFSDEKIFFRNHITLVKPRNKDFSAYLSQKKVDMGLLEKEDFCKVAAGDFLLFDCEIVKGKIEINESSDYGFNKIQKKSVGEKIKSGTQIVSILEADCVVAVKDVVEESLLFKVIKEMNLSLNQKLKFQHFIDKIIKWFVPIIILIAISTSIVWLIVKIYVQNNFNDMKNNYDYNSKIKFAYLTYSFILERAISILVVSCPCAFGLAIPTVTTIALNKALKSGILIKNLSILPEIRKANCFVFDKTGTLTAVKKEVKVEYLNDKVNLKEHMQEEVNAKKSCCYKKKEVDEIKDFNNKKDDVNEFEETSLPIYEIIALIECEQKHPIAEILYSFAVKQIEEQMKIKSANIIENSKMPHQQQQQKDSAAISLINNSFKITSNGIEASIKLQNKVLKNYQNNNKDEAEQSETILDILIGNATFIFKSKNIQLQNIQKNQNSNNLENIITKLSSNASTNIFFCLNKEIRAIFAIDASSIIRPEIHFVLDSLRKANKKTLILSGDNKKSVEDVAKKLRFANSEFFGEVNHTEKKEILQTLKNADKNLVLMVGDGINDVLSLTEANYGISFNANSQLNLVAADIIFIKEDLKLILSLLKLSKLTYVFIWINIFWAFIYNIFMIPIASGVFYGYSEFMMSPTISSLSMLGSSLLIILTSNLLRCFDIEFNGECKSFGDVKENNFGFYDDDFIDNNNNYIKNNEKFGEVFYKEFVEEKVEVKKSCCGNNKGDNGSALLGRNREICLGTQEGSLSESNFDNSDSYKLLKE